LTLVVAAIALLMGGGLVVAADPPANTQWTTEELEAMGLDEGPAEDPPATAASGRAIVEATLVLQDGDNPGGTGGVVSILGTPFTNGSGAPGFTGDVDLNDDFVWYDTGIAWQNSSGLPTVLSGAETTSGVSGTGGFIYSPSTDGDDSVWTDSGLLAVENVQAPAQPAGTNSTFHSRPTMIPTGQAYWVAGLDPTGGTTSNARVLYTSTDGTPATIASVLQSGDVVDGLTISSGSSGIMFDYDFSDDGSHHIHELDMDTGSTTDDGAIYVDGSLVARESLPNGSGVDNWDNFDYQSINNSGDYFFTGDTDGNTATDEFIAYNGAISVREGDTIGGVVLATSMFIRGVGINNPGHGAVVLSANGTEHLFFTCDASDFIGVGQLILSVGDELDFDGNGTGDALVTDFNTSTHGLTLDDSGVVFVELDINYGATDLEAIVGLDLPSCAGTDLIINEIDYDQPSTDTEEFIEILNPTTAPINLNGYQLELVNGTGGGASIYNTIALPNVDLAAGDYYVVCGDPALVPNCDLDASPDTNLIQNGAPDAVGLRNPTGALADTVSYEGDTGAPYTEGSGAGLEDLSSEVYYSISRYPDGIDTDVNNVDLSGRCNSPGLPNFDTTTNCTQVPVELMSFTIE
jgi:hypothetical protein